MTGNENKKEYLKEYADLCYKLESLQEQLRSLREENEAAKIQTLTDMPKGCKQTDLSDYMCRIERLEEKIREKQVECRNKRIDIEEKITDIKNGIESTILRKKYIELKNWEDICVELNYSWRTVHRHHSKALSNLKLA